MAAVAYLRADGTVGMRDSVTGEEIIEETPAPATPAPSAPAYPYKTLTEAQDLTILEKYGGPEARLARAKARHEARNIFRTPAAREARAKKEASAVSAKRQLDLIASGMSPTEAALKEKELQDSSAEGVMLPGTPRIPIGSPYRDPSAEEDIAEGELADLQKRIQGAQLRARGGEDLGFDTEMERYKGLLGDRATRVEEMDAAFDEEHAAAVSKESSYQRQAASLRDRQEKAESEFEEGIAELEQDLKDFKIDPNRAYKNTWQAVASAIAVALGAYAQGLSGGKLPNTALEIVNTAIKRDIEAQKAELGKKKGLLNLKNNVYARMLQRHGDRRRAESEAFAAGMTVFGHRLNTMRAKATSQNQLSAIEDAAHQAQLSKISHLETARNRAVQNELMGLGLEVQLVKAGMAARGKKKESTEKKVAGMRVLINDLVKSWKQVGPWEATAGSLLGLLGEKAPDILGNVAGEMNEYRKRRLLIGKLLTQYTDGGRPTDKDFAIILSLFPTLLQSTSSGVRNLRALEAQLENFMGTGKKGGIAQGVITNWANKAGRDADELLKDPEMKQAVKGLKSDMGQFNQWSTFKAD